MGRQITHDAGRQIVPPATLRSVLRADGESCYCRPNDSTEWDAGTCPQHGVETRYQPDDAAEEG